MTQCISSVPGSSAMLSVNCQDRFQAGVTVSQACLLTSSALAISSVQ